MAQNLSDMWRTTFAIGTESETDFAPEKKKDFLRDFCSLILRENLRNGRILRIRVTGAFTENIWGPDEQKMEQFQSSLRAHHQDKVSDLPASR